MGKLFGTDGVRGQANCDPVTPEMALQIGKAVAAVIGASGHSSKRVVLGKDTRLSGYMLESALTSGLVSMGADVFLVGPVPTPAVAHLTRSLAADAGIMVTASHNPFDDNGIKLFNSDGYKLDDAAEEAISERVLSGRILSDHIRSDQLGKAYRVDDARGRYIEFTKSTIRNEKLSPLKIVLDAANGAGYQMAPYIFRELGASIVKMNTDPDGYNINNGCGALHPEVMAGRVRECGADLGIALDGDADRVIFSDADGCVVDGDRILAICALAFHEAGVLAEDTLVCTSMSNLGLHEAMKRHGISVAVTDVGDRYVIERMRASGLSLGGEKSGHLIFHDFATTGDGIISALQVMRVMKQTGKSLATLAACMEEYPQRLTGLKVREKPPIPEVPALAAAIREAEQALAGVGRIVVRYSGTEPKIRILVEARTQALVDQWHDHVAAAIYQTVV